MVEMDGMAKVLKFVVPARYYHPNDFKCRTGTVLQVLTDRDGTYVDIEIELDDGAVVWKRFGLGQKETGSGKSL
jgi:hypothetical protein